MVRLTQLDDVLFPVEERPLFVRLGDGEGARMKPVAQKKAIVRSDTGRVLGVVIKEYRLVSNRQALDWGLECCRVVFPETQESDWEVKAPDAPGSGGYCTIDLRHNSSKLDFQFVAAKDRPDVFGPFIRVTNSYNTLKALRFDIGYFRKVCTNGLIMPDAIVKFHFVHSRRAIGDTIKFEVARERLAKFRTNFAELLGALRDCSVPRSLFEPLTLGVLQIHEPKGSDKNGRRNRDWALLKTHVRRLCDHYAAELGENAYAVFNTITDFASRPLNNRCVHRERHNFQRSAGKWFSEFSRQCREPGFKIEENLKTLGTTDNDAESAAVNGRARRPQLSDTP